MLDIVAIIAFALTFGIAVVAVAQRDIARNRVRSQEYVIRALQDDYQHLYDQAQQRIHVVAKFLEAVDRMNECNAELERHNQYLEARRHVILRRWWKRSAYRPLTQWRVRKVGGA